MNALLPKKNKILSPLKCEDLIAGLDRVVDQTDGVLPIGQVPGSKPFTGFVAGDSFRLRKKRDSLNPFARDVYGKVLSAPGGSSIEYSFDQNSIKPGFLIAFCSIAIPVIAVLGYLVLNELSLRSLSGNDLLSFTLIVTAAVLLATIIIWKLSGSMSYRSDEEILDCLRRIAAGASPGLD